MDLVRASEPEVSGSYCYFQGMTDFTQTHLGKKWEFQATCPTDWGKTKKQSFKFEDT